MQETFLRKREFRLISSREISPGSADERSHVRMFTCIASLIVFTSKNDQRSTICRLRKTEARDTNFVKRGREVYNTGKYVYVYVHSCTKVHDYNVSTHVALRVHGRTRTTVVQRY